MASIFVSHSKHDASFCDAFDRIVARIRLRAFRSELENVAAPAWQTIHKEINSSVALFFLVGKELVKQQDSPSQSWLHTQSWIAYEIGVACQKGIDVWSICDDVDINFPMPYVNPKYCTKPCLSRSFAFCKRCANIIGPLKVF